MITLVVIVLGSAETCAERFPHRAPSSARAYFNAFDALFVEAGRARNIDPALLKAIGYCETRLDPCAVSAGAGAQGLMQFMPATFASVGPVARAVDPFDPRDAIRSASLYIAALVNYWQGDLIAVIASYNAGPTAVWRARRRGRRIPAIAETEQYVACVTEAHAWLRSNTREPAAAVATAQQERTK